VNPTPRPGTARSALRHRRFRLIFLGVSLSNVGTWMQNFILPAYLDARTGSAALVGLLVFAQLGPQLVLSIPSGVLADRVDRTRLVLAMQSTMMALSFVLAALAATDRALWTLFVVQLAIGVANTIQAPAFNASLPTLVPREDLPGAVSLNSAMINGSRIAGPALAAVLASLGLATWQLFAVNGLSYVFLMVPLVRLGLPSVTGGNDRRGWRALTVGVTLARRRGVLSRLLVSMAVFSLVSLPYIGLFPSVARLNLGLDAVSVSYKVLYVVWGAGAFLGALSVGTVFAGSERSRLIVRGLVGFAVFLGLFALVSSYIPALMIAAGLGFVYFMVATTMVTELQHNLRDDERASVMPLWFMSFGGMVPVGNLLAGPIMDAVGARWVLAVGAAAALGVARWVDLRRLPASSFLDDAQNPPSSPDSPAARHL
jgi:MFS family permease